MLNLNLFEQALDSRAPIDLFHGKWEGANWLDTRHVTWFFKSDQEKISELARKFVCFIDSREPFPYREVEKELYHQVHEVAYRLLNVMKGSAVKNKLKHRIVALTYRIEDTPPVGADFDGLLEHAEKWRERQWQMHPELQLLSQHDRETLEELNHYSALIPILEKDRALRELFFKFCLRDHHPVEVFVKYPAAVMRLKAANLFFWMQKHPLIKQGSCLRLKEGKLLLQAEGKEINLLREKETVTLRGNRLVSVKELLDCHRDKTKQPGAFQFFPEAGGFQHYNSYKWGYFDEDLGNWRVEDEPYQLDILTTDQVKHFFGRWVKEGAYKEQLFDAINQKGIVMAACATRQTPSNDIDNSHAYKLFALPSEGDNWTIYCRGKYPEAFPKNPLEYLWFFAGAHHAVYQSHDDNIAYQHRQHIVVPYYLPKEKRGVLVEREKETRDRCPVKNEPFIWGSHSCAKHITDEFLALGLPDPDFDGPPSRVEPKGFIGVIAKLINQLPESLHTHAWSVVLLTLGAWRGVEVDGRKVSLYNSENWKDKRSWVPAYLFDQAPKWSIFTDE